MVKNPSANAGDAGDPGSIPGSGRSPGEGNGNPLQDSCLGNPMDRGAWWTAVHGVAKSQARLKRLSTAHTHSQTYICTHTHTYTHTHTHTQGNVAQHEQLNLAVCDNMDRPGGC